MTDVSRRHSGIRSAVAGAACAGVTIGLARTTIEVAAVLPRRSGSPFRAADLEAAVVLLVAAAGTLAAATVTVGCLLLTLAAGRPGAGRIAAGLLRAGSLLTPRALRRILVVGVGLALVAPGAHATDADGGQDGPGLGWVVTTDVPGAAPGTSSAIPVRPAVPRSAATGAGSVSAEPGRSLAGEHGAAARPVAVRTAAHSTPSPSAEPAVTAPVVVRPGDTLWAIARAHLPDGAPDGTIAAAWPRWYAANADLIGPDPDLIRPGQHLVRPDADPEEQS